MAEKIPFDEMTVEEIHGIERVFDNDAVINDDIVKYFINSDRFDLAQEMEEITDYFFLYQ